MRAAAIKMKMYAKNAAVINGAVEARILNVLLASFGVMAFFYVVFVGTLIFNIVAAKTFDREARILAAEVADLELSYLALSAKVDLSYGESLGFKEANAVFTTKKNFGLAESNEI